MFIDFMIGVLLMNAMPHTVLGIWRARILGAFGYSPTQNILYGLCCLLASVALYAYKYSFGAMAQDGMYLGALVVIFLYLVTGRFIYRLFNKER